jgi:hypothetical protein
MGIAAGFTPPAAELEVDGLDAVELDAVGLDVQDVSSPAATTERSTARPAMV